MMVFISSGKLHDEISTSPRGLGILCKALVARKLSKPDYPFGAGIFLFKFQHTLYIKCE